MQEGEYMNNEQEITQGIISSECDGMGIPISIINSNYFSFGEKLQFFVSTCTERPFWKYDTPKEKADKITAYKNCLIIGKKYEITNLDILKKEIIMELKKYKCDHTRHLCFLEEHKDLCPPGWID